MTSKYRFFSLDEFACSETGENEISRDFVAKLDELRAICGFPFVITSGYRSPNHSIEKAKTKPGMHSQGVACDISITNGVDRFKIVNNALRLGFTGVGVAKTFIHLDTRSSTPVMWTY